MLRWLIELIEIRRYNKELYRSGMANRNEIRLTTIGWRASDEQIKVDGISSPSGSVEYHVVIRE